MSGAPDDLPRFYLSKSAWPPHVRRYAAWLCWTRMCEALGEFGQDRKLIPAGDDAVIEWMYRSRNGVRAMASAAEIWPKLCEDATKWADQERAKAQRTEER